MSLTHCTRFSASELESCISQEIMSKSFNQTALYMMNLNLEGERRHIWCYTFPSPAWPGLSQAQRRGSLQTPCISNFSSNFSPAMRHVEPPHAKEGVCMCLSWL